MKELKNFVKEVSNIGNIGKLIITARLQKYIEYLHYKVGSTEWSGILFYTLTGGDIEKLKGLEFTADFLFPMDIGSIAYTEFDYDGELIKAYDVYEEGLSSNTGIVHSHHNMTTFFSGTDMSELTDNAGNYNFYVSLIVNFSHNYSAKIAIPAKTESSHKSWIKNLAGKLVPAIRTEEKELLLIGDLTVVINNVVAAPEWLSSRISKLKEVKTSRVTPPNFNFDEPFIRDYSNTTKVTKDVSSVFYLNCLLQLNSKPFNSVYKALADLYLMSDIELALYEDKLDSGIKSIHNSSYGSDESFQTHCLEALIELTKHKPKKDSEGYQILMSTLSEYGTI